MAKLSSKQLRKLHAGATGFNVKLKKIEVIQNPKIITTKNNRRAIAGIGSDGTKIFRFIKG